MNNPRQCLVLRECLTYYSCQIESVKQWVDLTQTLCEHSIKKNSTYILNGHSQKYPHHLPHNKADEWIHLYISLFIQHSNILQTIYLLIIIIIPHKTSEDK